jgi:hypothetical protein
LKNVKLEANRDFRNKKREYLKDKFDELATKSKKVNIRDVCREINESKKGYQPRTKLVKDENACTFP